jgi:RimJ/RimL family protein N-acetyltransferase
MTLITDTVGGGAIQGTTIALTSVRPARAEDRRALEAMAERASDDTLWRRFHGAGRRVVERELDRIVHPTDAHRSWVALSPDGAIHGTATLARGRDGTVEAAFLVEDAWFRRGIGRSLFTALVVAASHGGIDQVVARVQADNERAIRFLRGVRAGARATFVGDGEVEVVVPVPQAARAVSRSAA